MNRGLASAGGTTHARRAVTSHSPLFWVYGCRGWRVRRRAVSLETDDRALLGRQRLAKSLHVSLCSDVRLDEER